jgi:hypothetical protein
VPVPHHHCSSHPLISHDSHLAYLRRALHALLGLPADRPLLRPSNACVLENLHVAAPAGCKAQTGVTSPTTTPTIARLLDVHAGLKPPGMPASVEGSQDRNPAADHKRWLLFLQHPLWLRACSAWCKSVAAGWLLRVLPLHAGARMGRGGRCDQARHNVAEHFRPSNQRPCFAPFLHA